MGVQNDRRHGIASAHFMCPSKPSDVAIGEFAWETADGERRYQRRVCAAVEPRTSAVHRSQARHTAGWRAELCPRPLATPTMSRTAPTNAELAALARNHVYYEVAVLRTATSTTTTVRLPIRCQQATST